MAKVDILVCSEQPKLLRELLGAARRKADELGWSVGALPVGAAAEDAGVLGEYGANMVYKLPAGLAEGGPEATLAALSQLVAQETPDLVLVGATKNGMEVAPRLAERKGMNYAPWTVGFEVTSSGSVTARCMLYSGTGLATYTFKPGPLVLTAAPNVFEAQETPGSTAQVVELQAAAPAPAIQVVERKAKAVGGASLEEARTVVDVGQGVRTQEDLALITSLADLLDGQLACSRPVSSDRDWFPEWLGLSGKKVAPELCMTVGVSGAIQHLVGIRDSHLIVAVNSDEGAPIFNQADYGVVADLYEFVPALIERLKARGVRPAWS